MKNNYLYYNENDYELYKGKMQDVLSTFEENSVDSIVCDPPYELNFMGKGWDNSGVAFQLETWKHCFDVLKEGGYLLAFGGSRTFHRIACAIEDAGFEIRDTIMWLYGSGFPKSMDISKQIDKRGGESTSWFGEYLKNTLKEKNMTYSDLAKHFLSKTGGTTGCVHNWVEGKNMPTIEQFNKICEILDLPFKKMKEAEREVIGGKKSGCFNNQEKDRYTIGSDKSLEVDITAPSTDLAKQWSGWGTALKPAYEPIIVARKPFKGSLVDNVIKNGVGGINIDECRVETTDKYSYPNGGGGSSFGIGKGIDGTRTTPTESNPLGRFPANVILTYDETDFEEVCGGMPDTKSTTTTMPNLSDKNAESGIYSKLNAERIEHLGGFNDSGSASRYFYCAKASKKDRDEGLDLFEESLVNDGRKKSIDNAFQRGETPRKNIHPTVKPVELMQYLVRLVTPKGGTIMDCFMGSGSTGKAVMFENRERNANYKFIGVEMTEEYLPICHSRIYYAKNKYEYDLEKEIEELKKEKEEQGYISLFDL